VSFGDVSDEELMQAAGMPIDNLARQKKRGAGVDKFADPTNLADDELFAAAGISPGASKTPPEKPPMRELVRQPGGGFTEKPAPGALPPDAITTDELYALGSSPQTLRANLATQHHKGAEAPRPPGLLEREFVEPWRKRFSDPLGALQEEAGAVGPMLTKVANAATAGGYGALRNMVGGWIDPESNAAANDAVTRYERERPMAANLASGVGYALPIGPANMIGRSAAAIGEGAAGLAGKAGARFLERPLAGAVTGAVGAGGIGAAETAAEGGSLSDVGESAARGAKYGALFGGGIGTAQGALGGLREGAEARKSARNLSDFTEGGPAGKRDRVVGKGGEKYDRIDSLARRTPELEAAAGDPIKQKPIVEAQIDRTGAQLDDIYSGVAVRPQTIAGPMREVAAEIRSKAHTSQEAAEADALLREADHVEQSWSQFSKKGRPGEGRPIQPESEYTNGTSVGVAPREPTVRMSHDEVRGVGYRERGYQPPPEVGYIDARPARQMITNYGKGLYAGNPNNPVPISKAIKQEVYRRQVAALGDVVEQAKPGVREELNALNAEHSDWLNIRDAVDSRAGRSLTPSMTGKGIVNKALDSFLGFMHPGHYLLKKGVEHYGPGALRGIDNQLSLGGASLQEANPLIRALEAEREQSRRRAEMVKQNELSKKQFEEEERQQRAQYAFPQQEN
jgi:hypothetical protein